MKKMGKHCAWAACWVVLAAQAAAPEPDASVTMAQAAAGEARAASRPSRPPVRSGVSLLRLETGLLPDAPEADSVTSVVGEAFVMWQPSRAWEFRAGARVDGEMQHGGAVSYDRWRADLGDTHARYRAGGTRLTFGAQTVVWGRADEIPLVDRVSRADLTRFVFDDLADRRRAVPAVRWEQDVGDYKLDVVGLPLFRPAALPDLRSVWSPVDQRAGRLFGIDADPALSAFVRGARVSRASADDGAGGGGIRLTRTGVLPLDFGLTVARTRQTLPYYRADFARNRLVEVHPYQNFVGADAEFVAGDVTWRTEIGYTEGLPFTSTAGTMVSGRAWDWIGAAEFFPGGGDVRVNLQLVARHARVRADVLERTDFVGINGEVETTIDRGRWRLGLRFASGLSAHDLYLAPGVSFVGWEPHELYVQARYFAGDARSLGGFHSEHGMLAVGLRTRF